MQTNKIILRPAIVFALIRIFPLFLLSLMLLFLAWWLSPFLILFSLGISLVVFYRFLLVRSTRYLIEPEFIRITTGIFFKRTDQVELFRVKDYIITQPLLHQLFKIMEVRLKTTDPANPVILFRGIPESDIIDTIRERVQHARQHNKIVEIN